MAGRRKSKPVAVGRAIEGVLSDLGLDAVSAAHRVSQQWESAVGPEIARHCRPVGMRGTVLETTVDSSVWCQQLQLQRPRLLEALREAMGDEAPTDLRFRVGRRRL